MLDGPEFSEFDRALERALGNFTKGTKGRLEDLGEYIADEMRETVPVDTSRTKQSIRTKVGRDAKGHYVEIRAGGAAVPNEFGTSKMEPQPFFRPSLRKGQRAARSKLRSR
jgi:HK97 gp10 family phage protein